MPYGTCITHIAFIWEKVALIVRNWNWRSIPKRQLTKFLQHPRKKIEKKPMQIGQRRPRCKYLYSYTKNKNSINTAKEMWCWFWNSLRAPHTTLRQMLNVKLKRVPSVCTYALYVYITVFSFIFPHKCFTYTIIDAQSTLRLYFSIFSSVCLHKCWNNGKYSIWRNKVLRRLSCMP